MGGSNQKEQIARNICKILKINNNKSLDIIRPDFTKIQTQDQHRHSDEYISTIKKLKNLYKDFINPSIQLKNTKHKNDEYNEKKREELNNIIVEEDGWAESINSKMEEREYDDHITNIITSVYLIIIKIITRVRSFSKEKQVDEITQNIKYILETLNNTKD